MLLMGDAAHVHSPAGGQGMNTGLVDAVVLARLLSDVVSGRRPDSDLDRYEAIRRPAALQVIALADRLTNMALAKGRIARFLRNRLLATLGSMPGFRKRLQLSLSGLDRKQFAALAD